jgi:hypothetical protein
LITDCRSAIHDVSTKVFVKYFKACSVEAFHQAPPEQKRVSTTEISNQLRWQKGRPVHLSELDDDRGGRSWGCREAELGKGGAGEVGDAGEVESSERAASYGDNGREGQGTSMSSTTLVEARGGNSGAAGRGGIGKQNQRRGRRRRQQC